MEIGFVIVVLILVVVAIRLLAGSFDGERVERYLAEKGCELVDRSWAPFGPGWFGERDARIYEVVYRAPDGRLHRAHAKTSMLSGVYLTNDRVVEEPPGLSRDEEIARLRRRLEELESSE